MRKAYWINTFRSIRDEEKLATYVALAGPALRAAGAGSWRGAFRRMPSSPGSWKEQR